MNIFEQATRVPLRFESPQGLLTVEDLWNLPLRSTTNRASLNEIGKAINKKIKETAEEDLVSVPGKAAVVSNISIALDVVKHIIAVKEAENTVAANAAAVRAEKQKLLALLDDKKTEALGSLTIEEIEDRIKNLAG